MFFASYYLINQSSNQTINGPIVQSKSINQSNKQAINQSIKQSLFYSKSSIIFYEFLFFHGEFLRVLYILCVVFPRAVLEIPVHQSPKLSKGINPDHIIAMGKHRGGKVKSYWFAAESDEIFHRLKSVLGEIVGHQAINLDGAEVRKIWSGQGEAPGALISTTTTSAGGAATITNGNNDTVQVSHRETVTYVRDVPDTGNGDAQTPRRKAKTAKEAFFESKWHGKKTILFCVFFLPLSCVLQISLSHWRKKFSHFWNNFLCFLVLTTSNDIFVLRLVLAPPPPVSLQRASASKGGGGPKEWGMSISRVP